MKKTVVLSCMLLAAIALSACGGGAAAAKVTVATDATWPPFEIVDESTKAITGFDIDLFKAIAAKEGLELEFVNVGFDPLLAGIAQCQYDAAISAITITEERKQEMLFSDPYFAAGQLVSVGASNTDILGKDNLGGKVVGAQIGTTGAIEVEAMSDVTLKTYDDIGLAFQDLMNGQVDAVVADSPTALGYVAQNPDKLKTVGEVFTDEAYGIAVCKDKPELVETINAGLAAVKSEGLIDQLTTKWIASGQ
jgi:polar amino acid transport system substrate-binding protein